MIEDTMRSVKPYLEELLSHYPVISKLTHSYNFLKPHIASLSSTITHTTSKYPNTSGSGLPRSVGYHSPLSEMFHIFNFVKPHASGSGLPRSVGHHLPLSGSWTAFQYGQLAGPCRVHGISQVSRKRLYPMKSLHLAIRLFQIPFFSFKFNFAPKSPSLLLCQATSCQSSLIDFPSTKYCQLFSILPWMKKIESEKVLLYLTWWTFQIQIKARKITLSKPISEIYIYIYDKRINVDRFQQI